MKQRRQFVNMLQSGDTRSETHEVSHSVDEMTYDLVNDIDDFIQAASWETTGMPYLRTKNPQSLISAFDIHRKKDE